MVCAIDRCQSPATRFGREDIEPYRLVAGVRRRVIRMSPVETAVSLLIRAGEPENSSARNSRPDFK